MYRRCLQRLRRMQDQQATSLHHPRGAPHLFAAPTSSPRTLPESIVSSQRTKWCTGKDSNLRTSQGGADLQSAGFNHSPTCASQLLAFSCQPSAHSNTVQLRAKNSIALSDRPRQSFQIALCHWDQKVRVENHSRLQLIWKIPLWCADGKALCPPCKPCHARNSNSGTPQSSLELAKGFEPLTL